MAAPYYAVLHNSPEYWLTAPPYDETNMEPETVRTQFNSIIRLSTYPFIIANC